jgi:hypothetical protein
MVALLAKRQDLALSGHAMPSPATSITCSRASGCNSTRRLRYGNVNDAGASPTCPDAKLLDASLHWRKMFERDFALTVALGSSRAVGTAPRHRRRITARH